MFDHIADAIKAPDFVRLDANLYVARFETMKVYSTLVAVEQLLRSGRVAQGDTLLDSSSGIYAYALALACHKFGMRCHIIASKTVDPTLMLQLRLLGATVEPVAPAATLKLDQSLRVARIAEILASEPDVHWMQQYHDDIHYGGYAPIAAQIAALFGDRSLTLVGGVGSGCSTGGLTLALRAQHDDVDLIGIQPFGSVTFGSDHIADPGIVIAGIGTGIPFRNVRHALYDQIQWIGFDYAMAATVALLRRHAVFAGLSSGACYLAARREAALRPERAVLFIAPDTGHRYVDAVYARHHQAQDIDLLAPMTIASVEQLALPWSAMAWTRRPDPSFSLPATAPAAQDRALFN